MIRKSAIAALGVAAAAFALPAAAQMSMSSFYVGGQIGQSKFSEACEGDTGGIDVTCDDKDTAWKIFAGYQFHPNFAVELGYANLGSAKASATLGGITSTAEVEATAFDLVAIGAWPINQQFSVYGKLGIYHGNVDATASVTGGGSSSESDSGNDLTYGLGVRFDFSRNLGARAEWQRYTDFSGSDIDVLSLGVVYRFR